MMDLPTDLPMFGALKCPHCAQKIGMHLVKNEFACPHCKCVLNTNVSKAYGEGFLVLVVAMLMWAGWGIFAGIGLLDPLTSIALLVAFYMGHLWYRWRLLVRVAMMSPNTALGTPATSLDGPHK